MPRCFGEKLDGSRCPNHTNDFLQPFCPFHRKSGPLGTFSEEALRPLPDEPSLAEPVVCSICLVNETTDRRKLCCEGSHFVCEDDLPSLRDFRCPLCRRELLNLPPSVAVEIQKNIDKDKEEKLQDQEFISWLLENEIVDDPNDATDEIRNRWWRTFLSQQEEGFLSNTEAYFRWWAEKEGIEITEENRDVNFVAFYHVKRPLVLDYLIAIGRIPGPLAYRSEMDNEVLGKIVVAPELNFLRRMTEGNYDVSEESFNRWKETWVEEQDIESNAFLRWLRDSQYITTLEDYTYSTYQEYFYLFHRWKGNVALPTVEKDNYDDLSPEEKEAVDKWLFLRGRDDWDKEEYNSDHRMFQEGSPFIRFLLDNGILPSSEDYHSGYFRTFGRDYLFSLEQDSDTLPRNGDPYELYLMWIGDREPNWEEDKETFRKEMRPTVLDHETDYEPGQDAYQDDVLPDVQFMDFLYLEGILEGERKYNVEWQPLWSGYKEKFLDTYITSYMKDFLVWLEEEKEDFLTADLPHLYSLYVLYGGEHRFPEGSVSDLSPTRNFIAWLLSQDLAISEEEARARLPLYWDRYSEEFLPESPALQWLLLHDIISSPYFFREKLWTNYHRQYTEKRFFAFPSSQRKSQFAAWLGKEEVTMEDYLRYGREYLIFCEKDVNLLLEYQMTEYSPGMTFEDETMNDFYIDSAPDALDYFFLMQIIDSASDLSREMWEEHLVPLRNYFSSPNVFFPPEKELGISPRVWKRRIGTKTTPFLEWLRDKHNIQPKDYLPLHYSKFGLEFWLEHYDHSTDNPVDLVNVYRRWDPFNFSEKEFLLSSSHPFLVRMRMLLQEEKIVEMGIQRLWEKYGP